MENALKNNESESRKYSGETVTMSQMNPRNGQERIALTNAYDLTCRTSKLMVYGEEREGQCVY